MTDRVTIKPAAEALVSTLAALRGRVGTVATAPFNIGAARSAYWAHTPARPHAAISLPPTS